MISNDDPIAMSCPSKAPLQPTTTSKDATKDSTYLLYAATLSIVIFLSLYISLIFRPLEYNILSKDELISASSNVTFVISFKIPFASISNDLFVALDSYPSSSAAATTTHITASISKCIEDASANTVFLSLQTNPSREASISTDTYCAVQIYCKSDDKSATKKYPVFVTYPSTDASTNTNVKYSLSNDPFSAAITLKAFSFAEISLKEAVPFADQNLSLESSYFQLNLKDKMSQIHKLLHPCTHQNNDSSNINVNNGYNGYKGARMVYQWNIIKVNHKQILK